jgi:hypothetical protein
LDDRNFRALKMLSTQIFQSISTFDKMMDNITDAGLERGTLKPYFKSQAPYLEEFDLDGKPIVGDDYGDPPKIAVARDEGTHFLYLAFQRRDLRYLIRTDLEKLISGFSRGPFDDVVLAQSDGTVIYQSAQPGIGMARINALENASVDAKRGKADGLIALDSLSQSSRLEQVSIAGATYRLYSQPLQLPFAQAAPLVKGRRDSNSEVSSKPWILCGLVRDEQFRAESRAYSKTVVLWISVVILLAITALPFLKLYLSSAAERVRRFDVAVVAVSTCLVATILTFVFLDLVYWKKPRDESREQAMKALAQAIDHNFDDERKAAFSQLQGFYHNEKLKLSQTLMKIQERSTYNHPRLTNSGRKCSPTRACRVNILSDKEFDLDTYPYLLFATWTDARGQQVVKWTIRDSMTPFLNLADSSIPYYPAIKNSFHSIGTYPAPTEGIGSQYSPNTGENVTIFWKVLDQDGEPVPQPTSQKDLNRKWFCASLVTKPISVVDAILPAGFQFAIIKPNGDVVFHSDQTRNLRENFFAETDQDQEVRSRVASRAEGSLNVQYMGRPTRLYMHPMAANPSEPWTVVVFRGLSWEESANLELISVASILFVHYCVLIVIVLVLIRWVGKGLEDRSWFWPDRSKSETYLTLVIVNVVAAVAQLFLSQLPSLLTVLILGDLLPVVVFGCNIAILNRSSKSPSHIARLDKSWQSLYICACVTLAAAIAVVPCLAFFKVACDFEQNGLIESSQLKLAAAIKDRSKHAELRYQESKLGHYSGRLLATTEANASTPYFSYHTALGTSFQSTEKIDPPSEPNALKWSTADFQLHSVEVLMSWPNPFYNEFTADWRFLTQSGSSDRGTPGSSFKVRQDAIVLTQKGSVETIVSPWHPMLLPWNSWWWWLGVAFVAIFSVIVRITLRKMFLLDLVELAARPGTSNGVKQSGVKDQARLFSSRT